MNRVEKKEAFAEPGRGTAAWIYASKAGRLISAGLLLILAAGTGRVSTPAAASAQQGGAVPDRKQNQEQGKGAEGAASSAALTRGKRLILKDGTFQIAREYQRNGDRVRYFSAERGAWEELPASMVDWEATAKAEVEDNEQAKQLVEAAHRREAANVVALTDVDASLEVAQGVFLPPGEGMYVLEGKSVKLLEQVGTEVKSDKGRIFEQVISPVKIIPSKQRVQVPGAHAKLRIKTTQPEFYLREAPPDPDRRSPIRKSSRPGESGPEVELIQAKVKGGSRQIEWISTNAAGLESSKRNSVSIECWPVAANVYRYTIGEQLKPGEYALAELLPEGINLYVWDFGVDSDRTAPEKNPPADQTSKDKH
ncbi:MAG: hypothetical protein ABSF92_14480 [Candidatus Acidiferrales bacterium]|jgi:hypothetical protein